MSALDTAIEAAMATPHWEMWLNLTLFGLLVTAWLYPLLVLSWLVCRLVEFLQERR